MFDRGVTKVRGLNLKGVCADGSSSMIKPQIL